MPNNQPVDRRKSRQALVSVVLPVFNEAEVLPTLVSRVRAALMSCESRYELIFVDDGSTDASAELLDTLAAQYPSVRAVHLTRNFGHQAAVQAGLEHAQGDAVVLMDADLQDSPEAIPLFVAEWRAGYDVVYAVRTQRKEGLLKRALFAGFHRLMASIASVPIPADAGIFCLVDRRVVHQVLAMGESDRYFPGLRSWVGLRQKGLEVERSARYDEKPRVSLFGLCRLAKTAIFSFSTFPLRFFYSIGALAGLVFVGLSAYSLFSKLFTSLAIPGWTSHVLIASFFGALNALGICILGEYVIRIYDQVRNRPLYLVDRTVNLTAHESSDPADEVDEFDEEYLDLVEQASAMRRESWSHQAEDPIIVPFLAEGEAANVDG